MTRSLSEETKTRIADLYHTTDLSPGIIADALGVSVRTVNRYKDHNRGDRQDQTEQSFDEYEEPETIEFIGGTPFKSKESKKDENDYQCGNCGYTKIEKDHKYCEDCGLEFDLD